MKKCIGTCEACECKPQETKKNARVKEVITFEASYHCEGEKSICALYRKGKEKGSWNSAEWFSKRFCFFHEADGKYYITAPAWLLQKMGIDKFKLTLAPDVINDVIC